MSQNCSPSRARLANDLLESETKNSDRLSSFGCSRAMSDIIVEPQRPVLTMKTGGSMQAPRRFARMNPIFWDFVPAAGLIRAAAVKNIVSPGSSLIEPRHHVFGRGKYGARRQVEGRCRPAHQDDR